MAIPLPPGRFFFFFANLRKFLLNLTNFDLFLGGLFLQCGVM